MTKTAGILVQIREALGLKWQDFAGKLGYTNIYSYRNIENGGVRIGPQLKKRLITLFDVNPEFLETGEGEILRKSSQGNDREQKIMATGEVQIGTDNVAELKELLTTISNNMVLLQETINKQAEIIKHLELRNGRITDQLLDAILNKTDEASKKEEYPRKRSG